MQLCRVGALRRQAVQLPTGCDSSTFRLYVFSTPDYYHNYNDYVCCSSYHHYYHHHIMSKGTPFPHLCFWEVSSQLRVAAQPRTWSRAGAVSSSSCRRQVPGDWKRPARRSRPNSRWCTWWVCLCFVCVVWGGREGGRNGEKQQMGEGGHGHLTQEVHSAGTLTNARDIVA